MDRKIHTLKVQVIFLFQSLVSLLVHYICYIINEYTGFN